MKRYRCSIRTHTFLYNISCISFVLISSIGFTPSERSQQIRMSSVENIYLYDTLFFVSDTYNGIHIHSVATPSSPHYKNTILLKGNSGMAVRNNVVYANSYGSILAFRLNPDFSYDTIAVIKSGPNYDDILLDKPYHGGFFSCMMCPAATSMADMESSGTGGSYAIFAVIDSFLYYIDGNSLVTLDISDADTLKELSKISIDWTIETLFSTRNYLYIGGRGGMYVMDRSDPAKPKKICTLRHFQAYDPVVVQDAIAYVTLRAGNWGGNARDVLLVVSVAHPKNAYIINEVSTPTPYGLTVRDTLLYVSNGHRGFTLYNVKNPKAVDSLKYWSTPETRDFIWHENILYTMGFKNVIVYDVADPKQPVELSRIQ